MSASRPRFVFRQPEPVRPRGRLRRIMRLTVLVLAGIFSAAAGAVAVTLWRYPVPWVRLESGPTSARVTDRSGRLLLSHVGQDDQWHRPVPLSEVSPWVLRATIAVEDERFEIHPGVDPLAIGRALVQNLVAGRTVSGASTLTMQLARMLDDRPRTWSTKLIEASRALAIERRLTKIEVLEHYLNRAPYGANVLGIEAAARFWFDRSASELSLGQAALLAGLPQSPSRLRPDRHPTASRARRETVLRRLLERGEIGDAEYRIAQREPLGLRTGGQNIRAPHAAWLALERRPAGGPMCLDLDRQDALERLLEDHREKLPPGGDWAIAVVEIGSCDLIALVGSARVEDPVDGQVNGADALRSPGSTLKPFFYATAFEAGRLAPDSRLDDIPIQRGGWRPRNFDGKFRGPIDAASALRLSLNVPAIHVAEQMGLARCLGTLRRCGVRFVIDPATRGGLALVTGAVETTLLDLVEAYATIGRGGRHRPIRLFLEDPSPESPALSEAVCAHLDHILSSRARRPHGLESLAENDVPWFMWKTGTSSGRRDAWAVGHNGRVAAGVWVGSFEGTGHPDVVGSLAAEPILAALFVHPDFRGSHAPPEPPSLNVRRPLPRPREQCAELSIESPVGGEVFLSPNGAAVSVACALSGADEAVWFLDHRRVEPDSRHRLLVPIGMHRLRALAPDGRSTAVSFSVE